MRITTRFFIYDKATKRIVTYCDKVFGKWCLDHTDPERKRLDIGWKQIIRHSPGFAGTAITTNYCYPDDAVLTPQV